MTDLFNKKVTIYNDISEDKVNHRRWDKKTINKCNIQGGHITETDGTIANIVNAKNVITKDISRYKPYIEYSKLPENVRGDYFTAKAGDFIVFSEVDDIVTTAQEFSQLQQKYKDSGIKVTSFSANIYGMSVDNIRFTNS